MPLARIITTSAKYSDGLADDLRSRGFQVLTSAPGDSVSESADLEITLNECPPEEARGVAADGPVTKDMRVFVTPQAFAGHIRSIEMFVLTPSRPGIQKLEVEETVEPTIDLPPAVVGKILEFTAPEEILSSDSSSSIGSNSADASADAAAEEVENPSASFEESVQPGIGPAEKISAVHETLHSDSLSTIGRAVLASAQASVPAWPNIAEMKLVPAELATAPVKPVGAPFQVALPPQEISYAGSVRTQSIRDKRFWKVPMVAAIAAILALSVIWLANHFSAVPAQAGAALQPVNTSSVEAAAPATTVPVSRPQAAPIEQSAPLVTPQEPAENLLPTIAPGKVRTPRARAKRRTHHSDADYVAKDTTVYFNTRPASPPGQKPQAQP